MKSFYLSRPSRSLLKEGLTHMHFRRVIVVDIASLGLGAMPDAKRYHSEKANTLGHLDEQYLLNVPTLQRLGLGNIRRHHQFLTIPPAKTPLGFYGKLKVRTHSGTKDASLREMFDFNEPLRTLSVFNHLSRCHYRTIIISRFISYLADQDCCLQIQSANDNTGFRKLINNLKQMDTGLIYLQVPELQWVATQKDPQGYAARLSIVDKQIELLMSTLTSTDLLIITSSFANDPSYPERQITREYLPLIMYTPEVSKGHYVGTRKSVGDIAATLIDNFKEPGTEIPLSNSLLRSM
ncbi:phosphopentomutase [Acetilactobacillus jinshanensis]|uniref:Phosphopentomutase n=2 Tax=Acetilactobacillus jinshanensis TaxID=1720083 RepID=A0A4P6ZJ20_9LACO|nr:phosphopentomutase [Acetilactobacillus jinshanensis]